LFRPQSYKKNLTKANFLKEKGISSYFLGENGNDSERRKRETKDVPHAQPANIFLRIVPFCYLFAVFAHYEKWRIWYRKTPLLATQRGASPNEARCVGQRSTLRWNFPRALSVDLTNQKVCKNTQKPPVLPSVDANFSFRVFIFNYQHADIQCAFDLSASF